MLVGLGAESRASYMLGKVCTSPYSDFSLQALPCHARASMENTACEFINLTRYWFFKHHGWIVLVFVYHLWPLSTVSHTWQTLYKYFTVCTYVLLTYFLNRSYWHTINKAWLVIMRMTSLLSLHLSFAPGTASNFHLVKRKTKEEWFSRLKEEIDMHVTTQCPFYDIPYQPRLLLNLRASQHPAVSGAEMGTDHTGSQVQLTEQRTCTFGLLH